MRGVAVVLRPRLQGGDIQEIIAGGLSPFLIPRVPLVLFLDHWELPELILSLVLLTLFLQLTAYLGVQSVGLLGSGLAFGH